MNTGEKAVKAAMSETKDTTSDKNVSFIGKIKVLSQMTTDFWATKISMKVTIMIFVIILAIQLSVTYMSYEAFKTSKLQELQENARIAIQSNLEYRDLEASALAADALSFESLLVSSRIVGLSLYTPDFDLINNYGQTPSLTLETNKDYSRTYFDRSGHYYESAHTPNALGEPVAVLARVSTLSLEKDLMAYLVQSVVVAILLSALLTIILATALCYWYLEPTYILTRILGRAIEDPENPDTDVHISNTGSQEISRAIEAAQDLIQQNAAHIQKIKENAEDRIHKLAYYDALTGLPNRTCFIERLHELKIKKKDMRYVVIALDLDHFKDVNDSMGHTVGDEILKCVSARLEKTLPPKAIVARAAADEFAVMLPIMSDMHRAQDLAEHVARIIKKDSFKILEENFQIHCSLGYAVYPDDGEDPDDVLKSADIALNRAKEEGRDIIRAYSKDFDRAVQARFHLLRDMRIALEEKQFSLHYQPQFDLDSGALIGAEALLRWRKPDNSKEGGQYISPGEFIPIAESSGLINPIGEWVFEEACDMIMEVKKDLSRDIRIAVNLSGVQFRQKDLVDQVKRTIEQSKVDPKLLELEVTESAFMEDMQHTVKTLHELHALGLELAIDDFGTGYSSLAYLRQFPIDRLKIDRSFIINALANPDDASITRTIIGLGKSLNLQVIAEGVETVDHQNFLISEGCNEVQGFKYARPMPKEDFMKFCEEYDGDLLSLDIANPA